MSGIIFKKGANKPKSPPCPLGQKEICASQPTTSTTYSNHLIRKIMEPKAGDITQGQEAVLSSDQPDKMDFLSFFVTH